MSRILTIWYFAHFFIVLPLLGRYERPRPVPNSISESMKIGAKAAVVVVLAVGLGAVFVGGSRPAAAQEHADVHADLQPPRNTWSFAGPFGKFDPGHLQRGSQAPPSFLKTSPHPPLLSFPNPLP